MLLVRNNAVLDTPKSFTADSAKIPFDTVVLNTNSNAGLSDNDIHMLTEGIYDTLCEVNVANAGSSAVTVTLTAYADGNAVTGAKATVTIPASGSDIIVLPWAAKIVPALVGNAKLSWYLSGGAVNLVNACAKVERIV